LIAGGGYFGNRAEIYDPATGQWTITGSMTSAHWLHTATLLPSGKVLVAGGFGDSDVISVAELYDPATGTWTATGSMNIRRSEHTATLLPNGKVLVAGGSTDGGTPGVLSSAELYDPTTGTWVMIGAMSAGRFRHTATLLPSGKVLIAGGINSSDEPLSSAELYDVGLGFNASWQPEIAAAPSSLNLGGRLSLTGSRFRGVSGGSGGNSQDSPTDYPVVQLRSLESGQTAFLSTTNWSTNSFTSLPVTPFPLGYALVTVFVNGIPSTSIILAVVPPPALGISLTSTNVLLTWPGSALGFRVESTASLASPIVWNRVTNIPSLVSNVYQITLPTTNGNHYFHLVNP
jgi:hypothetical protein